MERIQFLDQLKCVDPIERARKIGSAILDYLSFPCITEESTRPRGAAALLDEHLYDQPQYEQLRLGE